MFERRSIRLSNYDYRQAGAYFVTICCHNRLSLFGSITDGEIILSMLGLHVREVLNSIPGHHAGASIDAQVIMPNHLHMILCLHPGDTSAAVKSSRPPGARSLSAIVGSFKSSVSREWKVKTGSSQKIWQPGYYDHIVRHEGALNRIRDYIANNPLQWNLDRENPQSTGTNCFYAWMESYKGFLVRERNTR